MRRSRASEEAYAQEYNASIDKGYLLKPRRHILDPYEVNGHCVRYSVRLRNWVVDELHYFKTKKEAFDSAK